MEPLNFSAMWTFHAGKEVWGPSREIEEHLFSGFLTPHPRPKYLDWVYSTSLVPSLRNSTACVGHASKSINIFRFDGFSPRHPPCPFQVHRLELRCLMDVHSVAPRCVEDWKRIRSASAVVWSRMLPCCVCGRRWLADDRFTRGFMTREIVNGGHLVEGIHHKSTSVSSGVLINARRTRQQTCRLPQTELKL